MIWLVDLAPNIAVLVTTLILFALITICISKFLDEVLSPYGYYNFGVIVIITLVFGLIYFFSVFPLANLTGIEVAYLPSVKGKKRFGKKYGWNCLEDDDDRD